MKRAKKIMSTILVGVCAISLFAGCGKNLPDLAKIERLRVNNNILMWEGVENATEYVIVVNGVEYKTEDLYFELSFLGTGVECNIEIYAVGNAEQFDVSPISSITTTIMEITSTPSKPHQPSKPNIDPVIPSVNGLSYKLLSDGSGYEVYLTDRSYSGRAPEQIIIPDTFEGLPVKRIAAEAFGYNPSEHWMPGTEANPNTTTRSIRLPAGLETIGEYAFSECQALETIELPATIREIEFAAFRNCLSLKKILLPEGLQTLGVSAFFGSGLEEVTIPSTMEEIKESTFKNCKSLKTVTLPNNLHTINASAFYQSSLSKINLPESLKIIGENAFRGCNNLESLRLPSTVTLIEGFCFNGCESMQYIILSKALTTYHNSDKYPTFYEDTKLLYPGTELEWAENVKIEYLSDDTSMENTVYFYSETQPTEEGNYWHYGEDGKTPVYW